jgi:hypothetical protein
MVGSFQRPAHRHLGQFSHPDRIRSVTHSGAALSVSAQNVENFATNAADHAALRIRRGIPIPRKQIGRSPGL